MKATLVENGDQGVGLDSTGFYDQEIYGGSDSRFAGYVTSIAANEQEDVSVSEYRCFINHSLSCFRPIMWSLTAPVCSACELGESCLAGKICLDSCFVFLPQDDDVDTSTSLLGQKKPGYHAPVAILNAIPQSDEQVCVDFGHWKRVFDKQNTSKLCPCFVSTV